MTRDRAVFLRVRVTQTCVPVCSTSATLAEHVCSFNVPDEGVKASGSRPTIRR